MTWNPYPALPMGALRDLLGITRALYRAAAEEQPQDTARLQALEQVGRTLQSVLKAAREHPGTIAHQTAWAIAERVVRELGELVAGGQLVAPLIEATARRISRPRTGSMISP